jgi:multidrug efflux pump subunit AcrB
VGIKLHDGRVEIRTPFTSISVATITIFLTLAAFTLFGGLLYFALQVLWAAIACTLVALIVFSGMCLKLMPKPDDGPPTAGVGSRRGSDPISGGRTRKGRNSK